MELNTGNLQAIIDTLKNKFHGACKIENICKELNLTRKDVLIQIRKTMLIDKPNRKKDTIFYINLPELPEIYKELYFNEREPNNIEEVLFIFLKKENYIPTINDFHNYCKENDYNFHFNWQNKNNYQSAKKKILRIMRECKITKL